MEQDSGGEAAAAFFFLFPSCSLELLLSLEGEREEQREKKLIEHPLSLSGKPTLTTFCRSIALLQLRCNSLACLMGLLSVEDRGNGQNR